MTVVILSVLLVLVGGGAAVLWQRLAAARVENARLEERLHQQTQEQARLVAESEARFKALASGVLMQSTGTLQKQNAVALDAALKPVKDNLELFREVLNTRVRDLMELNRTVGDEARRLTDALRGNNTREQGIWGEIVLENILQRCGFQRGREYQVQVVKATDEGATVKPDVVVNFPDGHCIVIDSKVSVKDYLAMLEAPDAPSRAEAGQRHVRSVERHIAELRGKKYQDWLGKAKLDYVFMFIPNEGAFVAAMQLKPELWETAHAAGVVIVSPAHIIAVMRLVEQIWRHDRQEKNAEEIARQASAMLDKFAAFVEDMNKVQRALATAQNAWNEANTKLTGRNSLLDRARNLSSLGPGSKL